MGRAFEVRKVAMAKTAAVKSKIYAKYGKELYMAAKVNPDSETNLTLKRIIEKAKRDQVPADVIKRAIDKAKGGTDENYTSARYEGFGPGNSLFIIECLTDNVNRTIAEVRNCFTKTDGKLGVTGSVLHQFNHQAVFSMPGLDEDSILETLVTYDLDVQGIEEDDEGVTLYSLANDYGKIKTALTEAHPNIEPTTDEIMWLPIIESQLTTKDDIDRFNKLLQMLDEIDDVQDVYHNVTNEIDDNE